MFADVIYFLTPENKYVSETKYPSEVYQQNVEVLECKSAESF